MAKLIEAHDPDTGRLAELVHVYLDQNLLQPYEDAATRDSKYWVMMALAAPVVFGLGLLIVLDLALGAAAYLLLRSGWKLKN